MYHIRHYRKSNHHVIKSGAKMFGNKVSKLRRSYPESDVEQYKVYNDHWPPLKWYHFFRHINLLYMRFYDAFIRTQARRAIVDHKGLSLISNEKELGFAGYEHVGAVTQYDPPDFGSIRHFAVKIGRAHV